MADILKHIQFSDEYVLIGEKIPKKQALKDTSLEDAYQSGYEKGLTDGHQQITTQLQEQLILLNTLLETIPSAIHENRKQLSSEIADIVLVIAKQLFIHQQHDKKTITQQVHQIIEQLNDKQNLEIALHPQDLALLKSGEIQMDLRSCENLRFVADEQLRLGGCIIYSAHGAFNASIERQIENLKQVLLEIKFG